MHCRGFRKIFKSVNNNDTSAIRLVDVSDLEKILKVINTRISKGNEV